MSAFSVFRKDLLIKSVTGAEYNDAGDWVGSVEAETTIQASRQPSSPSDLNSVPENRRQSRAYTIFTDTELSPVGSQNPDKAVIDGDEYEIHSINKWNNDLLNHFKYVIVKVVAKR